MQTWSFFGSLTCQPIASARMRGLAARRFASKSPIPKKIHGGIFLGHTPDCRGGKAVREANGGSLATGTPESGEWKGINSRLQPTNECKIRNTVQKIKKSPAWRSPLRLRRDGIKKFEGISPSVLKAQCKSGLQVQSGNSL